MRFGSKWRNAWFRHFLLSFGIVLALATASVSYAQLPPGVVVSGQAYVRLPGPDGGVYGWITMGGMRVESDPQDFLWVKPPFVSPMGTDHMEFGVNWEPAVQPPPAPGAYEGYELISLDPSSAFLELDFDAYATAAPNWGYDFLSLQLWGGPHSGEWVLGWASVGPWSWERQHVHLSVPEWAGYELRITVVPEPGCLGAHAARQPRRTANAALGPERLEPLLRQHGRLQRVQRLSGELHIQAGRGLLEAQLPGLQARRVQLAGGRHRGRRCSQGRQADDRPRRRLIRADGPLRPGRALGTPTVAMSGAAGIHRPPRR